MNMYAFDRSCKINFNIPDSVTHLQLNLIKNKFKNFRLPKNLKVFTFGEFDNSDGDLIYPPTLKYLSSYSTTFDFSQIPKTIQNIGIVNNNVTVNNLPPHIKKIRLFLTPESNIKKYNVTNLPPSLEKIYIDHTYTYCDEFYLHKIVNFDIKIPFGCTVEHYKD